MTGKEVLTDDFEANRTYLRSVALRILGSAGEAEDAVQEAWLRLARADFAAIEDIRAWLTTVVARVCLDMLRARRSRSEQPIADAEILSEVNNAESQVEVADSIGLAMLVVLETLSPPERVAFVLHDVFNLPFDDIAPIVSRSPAAARKLASRARQRVQGAPAAPEADRARQRQIVKAFLAASQGGDFKSLLALLDPRVVLRADASAVAASLARVGDAPPLAPEIRGQERVANIFKGRAKAAQLALVDGDAGLVIVLGGKPRMVFDFVVEEGRIAEISLVADAHSVEALKLEF